MRRILAAVVLALIAAVIWLRWPADIPPEFGPLVADVQAFQRLEVVVGWPDPQLPVDREVTIVVRDDGTAELRTGSAALVLDGAVKLSADGFTMPLPDLTPRAEDLYAELRRGLSRSDWRRIDPPQLGLIPPAPDAAWASVTLPFDWAAGVELLLAVDRADGRLRYVMLSGSSAPLTVSTRPIQGGLRTVQLAETPFVRLPVRDVSVERP